MNIRVVFLLLLVGIGIALLPFTVTMAQKQSIRFVESAYTKVVPSFWNLPLKKTLFIYRAEGTVVEKNPQQWKIADKGKQLAFVTTPNLDVTQGKAITAEDALKWKKVSFDAIGNGDKVIVTYYVADDLSRIPVSLFLMK